MSAPFPLTSFDVVGVNIPTSPILSASNTNDDFVFDHKRSDSHAEAGGVIVNFGVPRYGPGFPIERYQMSIKRPHEDFILRDSNPTVGRTTADSHIAW